MPGVSLFALWFFPMLALAAGIGIGFLFYNKAAKKVLYKSLRGLQRIFFPKKYRESLKQRMLMIDKQLATGKLLGKRFIKNHNRSLKPTRMQKMLQALHIRRFEPKNLTLRQENSFKKQISSMKHYLHAHGEEYTTPYYKSHMSTGQEGSLGEGLYSRSYNSAKSYKKAQRESVVANDKSNIVTSSPAVKQRFIEVVGSLDYTEKSEKLKDNNDYFRMYVTGFDKTQALESFSIKDRKSFYMVGCEMLRHLVNNVPNEVYPINISQTIVKNGKEVRDDGWYTKDEVKLMYQKYEKQASSIIKARMKASLEEEQPGKV